MEFFPDNCKITYNIDEKNCEKIFYFSNEKRNLVYKGIGLKYIPIIFNENESYDL